MFHQSSAHYPAWTYCGLRLLLPDCAGRVKCLGTGVTCWLKCLTDFEVCLQNVIGYIYTTASETKDEIKTKHVKLASYVLHCFFYVLVDRMLDNWPPLSRARSAPGSKVEKTEICPAQSRWPFYVFFPSRIFRSKVIVYRKKLRLLVETVHINKRCGPRGILIRCFLLCWHDCGADEKNSTDVRLRKERGVKWAPRDLYGSLYTSRADVVSQTHLNRYTRMLMSSSQRAKQRQ